MKVDIRRPGKVYNKANIHIEPHDIWSVDHTLATIIFPMLIALRDKKHGVPNEFASVGGEDWEQQGNFDFYTDSYDWAFEEGCKRWDDVMNKMIWSFQQLAFINYDDQYFHGESEFDFLKTDIKIINPVSGKKENTYKVVHRGKDNWYDNVGHNLHDERIQEGLDLFAKYFRSLWD